ncbi:CBS domain-containing protein [Azoarcus sp. DN11]|uniref:CBS domain-containing protein n=1 Tax=Azoarcus sp. DN11 TaxID=356837 RepID=UPI002570CD27|nr:CBS domain-containing protein [Azoarcus sp. DN11]
MAADVVTVSADAPIAAAWALLARHRVKALPVVSAGGRLAGVVTLHDFFVQGNGLPRARIAEHPGGDVAVRELMSPRVVTARMQLEEPAANGPAKLRVVEQVRKSA